MNAERIDVEAILGGSRGALARAATLLENDRTGASVLHEELLKHCGRAHIVGITGAPGAGKSTLVNALLAALDRSGRRCAVLAVDPSSPITGGALLGDRVRMADGGDSERTFIRSVSSRGHLGGLSRTAGRLIDLFDAAGFDPVLVETVGAGQSEVEIARFADTSVVVCPPGLGDEVQAIKAGILEIADLLVVNKGDLPAAQRTAHDLMTAPGLRRRGGGQVPVLVCTATTGAGVPELLDRIDEHAQAVGRGRRLRQGQGQGQGQAVTQAKAQVEEQAPGAAVPPPPATDDELFERVRAWRADGRGVALATVVRTWGSSPRAEGSHLAVEQDGGFIGSVSGGCVEGAVISEAVAAIADGKPRLLDFGVTDEQAWAVGLACGGRVQVYVERVG